MSKIAFLFPGQGAQVFGMGKDFYEQSPLAKEAYDEASDLLSLDMKALCFEENDKLNITEYTQAALLTTCLAMERVIRERGLVPDVTAGLSLGEYCAINSAGGMSFADAVKTVRLRGILMQDTVPVGEGAMSAVLGMTPEAVEEVLKDREMVWPANYNCPGQIIITGAKGAVEAAAEPLKAAGAKRILPLNVSGPFHSPMLLPAGEKLGEALDKITLGELKVPYITNVTAQPVSDISETKDLLRRQVASPVKWQQSMEFLIADGVDTFVEIGPGKTLSGFMRKIDRSKKVYNIEKWEDVEKVLEELKG